MLHFTHFRFGKCQTNACKSDWGPSETRNKAYTKDEGHVEGAQKSNVSLKRNETYAVSPVCKLESWSYVNLKQNS